MKRITYLFSLLLLCFGMGMMPITANATEHNVSNSAQLTTAITNSVSGDIIKLGTDINYTSPITISGKSITIDLNDYSLTLNTSIMKALEVINGEVKLINTSGLVPSAAFNVHTLANAVEANNSTVTVSNVTRGYPSVIAKNNSTVEVLGNAEGALQVENGSIVKIAGNFKDGDIVCGINAADNCTVIIDGSIIGTGSTKINGTIKNIASGAELTSSMLGYKEYKEGNSSVFILATSLTPITALPIPVTEPATGVSPVTTISTTFTEFTCALSWNPTHDPFQPSTIYTATITLTVKNDAVNTFSKVGVFGNTEQIAGFTVNTYTPTKFISNNGWELVFEVEFPETDPITVTGISVKTPPTKLNYIEGQTLDLSGLVVMLTYNFGSSLDVPLADFGSKDISTDPAAGTTLATTHNATPVTVIYDHSATIRNTTSNLSVSAKKVIQIDVLTLPNLDYYKGDVLDLSGLEVELTYDNGVIESNVLFADFLLKGGTASPAAGTSLAIGQNGDPVTVSCGDVSNKLIGYLSVTKEVKVSSQLSILKELIINSSTFIIDVFGIDDGNDATITWYTDGTGSTTTGTPSGIADPNSPKPVVTGSTATLKIITTTSAQKGVYYFKVEIDGVVSDIVELTINGVPVTKITIEGAGGATSITTNGGTLQMDVTEILPIDATNTHVTWSVISGTGSATINNTGLLTAIGNGTVTVRATAVDGSGIFGECIITISGQTTPYPPQIFGTKYMTLVKGYQATSTTPYSFAGTTPITVEILWGDSHITWNNSKKTLDIAPGLPAGVYEVRLQIINRVSSRFFTFTLTVTDPVYYIEITSTVGGSVVAVSHAPFLAREGETVTLNISLEQYFVLQSLQVFNMSNRSVTVPLSAPVSAATTYTFKMPAHNVSIMASFRDTRGTEIEEVKAVGLKAYAQSGTLYVSGLTVGNQWSVYNSLGMLVYRGTASDVKAEITLPARGIYIVSDGKKAIKAAH